MVTDTQHIKPFYVVLYITVTTTKKNWRRRKKDMGTKNQFLRISLNQIIFNVCVQQKYCCCLSFWRLSSCYFCFFAWELSYPLQVLQCWQLLDLFKHKNKFLQCCVEIIWAIWRIFKYLVYFSKYSVELVTLVNSPYYTHHFIKWRNRNGTHGNIF